MERIKRKRRSGLNLYNIYQQKKASNRLFCFNWAFNPLFYFLVILALNVTPNKQANKV